jgi:hypothetical protein
VKALHRFYEQIRLKIQCTGFVSLRISNYSVSLEYLTSR